MPNVTADRAGYVAALPTFTRSAEMIGIHPSGIGRAVKRLGIQPVRWGNRDKHLSVADLMVLAQDAHRESVQTVASRLLDHVAREHPEHAEAIRGDIGAFLAAENGGKSRLQPSPVEPLVLAEDRPSAATPALAAAPDTGANEVVEPMLRAPSEPETARRLMALYTLHGGSGES